MRPAPVKSKPAKRASVGPVGTPRLSLAKRALVTGPVRPGGSFRYRLTVTNTGTQTAVGVVVCDVLSRQLVFVSVPGASFSRGRACWSLERLGKQHSRSFLVTVRLDANAAPGPVVNDAIVSAKNVVGAVEAAALVRVKGVAATGRPGGVTG